MTGHLNHGRRRARPGIRSMTEPCRCLLPGQQGRTPGPAREGPPNLGAARGAVGFRIPSQRPGREPGDMTCVHPRHGHRPPAGRGILSQLRMASSARADSDLARQRLAPITAAPRAFSRPSPSLTVIPSSPRSAVYRPSPSSPRDWHGGRRRADVRPVARGDSPWTPDPARPGMPLHSAVPQVASHLPAAVQRLVQGAAGARPAVIGARPVGAAGYQPGVRLAGWRRRTAQPRWQGCARAR